MTPSLPLLIARARRQFNQVIAARTQAFGLTPQQFWTVVNLHETPGLSLQDLARRRQMDDPSASRLVATLLRRKLVQNVPDPDDRRRVKLGLTPEGATLTAELLPIAEGFRREMVRGLTRAEQAQLRGLLEKVIANAEGWGTERPAAKEGRRRKEARS